LPVVENHLNVLRSSRQEESMKHEYPAEYNVGVPVQY
jgi:hypothetical protein